MNLRRLVFSPAYDALCMALANETEWEYDAFDLHHAPTGVTLWIANGPWFLEVRPTKDACLGLIERHALWYKLKPLLRASKTNKNDAIATKLLKHIHGV